MRKLLRPGWLVLHVLVALALYAMWRLGVWQWGRGRETGSIRNYSYGLEWWAFVVLTVAGWAKFCLDETRPAAAEGAAPEPAQPYAATYVPPVDPEDDPELAQWNARFAELARRDAERSR